jgi:PST family polysaccharide transporter
VIQIVWAATLVGALIVGAMLDGIRGAAIAQLAVGALVVFPLYLGMLSRSGVRVGPMLLRAIVPLLAGLIALLGSILLAATLAPPIVPDVVAGLGTLALIGLLLVLERAAIAELRKTWATPATAVVAT